jgi:uncharacterized damage-inducible protein DinB
MDLLKLAEYQLWANDRVRELMLSLSEEEFSRDLIPPQGCIRNLCLHSILAVEYNLRRHIQKQDIDPYKLHESLFKMPIPEMMDHWRKVDEDFKDLASTHLDLEAEFPNFLGEGTMTVNHDDYYTQYLVHTAYHRSQIMSAMRILGKEGIGTDYLFYLSHLQNQKK